MTPERWARIQDFFHKALEQGPDAHTWLDATCEDTALLQEVVALLAAHEQVEDHLERAVEGAFALASEDDDEPERQHIGPYRVLRELGRGGLSTVYLAERADDEFHHQVAIKVVKRGMDTRDILSRLRRERQILATLDHPYIARLFDGGSTEDGLPYFVMEPIDGEPIDSWCDAQELSIEERLELFRKVCAAVQYAHQNLVVHRDIKPGNLLVTADGTPKLLDFGIAKLLDQGGATAYTATAAGMRLLTPNYASPEQIRGEPLTTATDIYSLGVLLYQLLTGQPPYEMPGSTAAMERVVCEEIPERPSTAVRRPGEEREARSRARAKRGEQLARRLRGDLDNIALMALRKEPQRRYASAQQFADDLKRYLEAMPVLARRDTFGYRAEKFIRRNRLAVLAAVLVFLSLAAGMVTTTWQARRAEAERTRAEKNLESAEIQQAKAERISDFMIGLFNRNNPAESRGEDITAREILDQGARRIDELALEPELTAELMDVMGTVYKNLGYYDTAEELLRRALEERRKAYGSHHPDVATTLDTLASLYSTRRDFETAEVLFEEALALRQALKPRDDREIANILNSLGVIELKRGDLEKAEARFRHSLELRESLENEDDLVFVKPQSNLAALLYRRGELEAAEELMRHSLAIRTQYYGEMHPEVANSLNSLAAVLTAQKRYDEAEVIARKALALRRQLLGDKHADLAVSLNNLAELLRSRKRLEEAEPHYREALQITVRALGEKHHRVSVMQMNLADLLAERGEVEQAETLYLESLALRRELHGPDHLRNSFPLLELGRIALGRGRPHEAEPLLRQALLLQEANLPEDSEDLAETRGLLGVCLLEQARFAAAEELLLQGYRVSKAKGEDDPSWNEARRRLKRLYENWGRPQEADLFQDPPP